MEQLTDYVFTPMLLEGGALANCVGRVNGIGPGRGIGLFVILAGTLVCVVSVLFYGMKPVRELEATHALSFPPLNHFSGI